MERQNASRSRAVSALESRHLSSALESTSAPASDASVLPLQLSHSSTCVQEENPIFSSPRRAHGLTHVGPRGEPRMVASFRERHHEPAAPDPLPHHRRSMAAGTRRVCHEGSEQLSTPPLVALESAPVGEPAPATAVGESSPLDASHEPRPEPSVVVSPDASSGRFSLSGKHPGRQLSLTFLSRLFCSPAAVESLLHKVRSEIHVFSPRARVYGFAEVGVSVSTTPTSDATDDNDGLPYSSPSSSTTTVDETSASMHCMHTVRLLKDNDAPGVPPAAEHDRTEPNPVNNSRERSTGTSSSCFHGIIQVVPVHITKQVSLNRLLHTPTLESLLFARPLFPYVVLVVMILTGAFFEIAGRRESSRDITIAAWCLVGLEMIVIALWALNLSRPICRLLLLTFDFWLVVFWIAIGTWVKMMHSQLKDNGTRFLAAGATIFAGSQLAMLFLDAFPSLSRVPKGLLFAANAAIHIVSYADWTIAVTMGDSEGSGMATNAVVSWIGGRALPLALLVQTTSGALAAFNIRLAFRCLWKRFDLAVVDFPVNVVPHHVAIDEAAGSSEIGEPSKEGGMNLDPSDTDVMECAPCDAPAPPRFGRQGSGDNSAHFRLMGSPKYADTSASLRYFDLAHGDEEHVTPETLRLRSTHSQKGGGSSVTFSTAAEAGTLHAQRSSDAGLIVLHVDGSLPCTEAESELLLMQITEVVEAHRGHLENAVVEPTMSFSSDRRTFLPATFLRCYLPTPVVPVAVMFRWFSWWAFHYCTMFIIGLSAIIMSAFLNNVERLTITWAQVLIRSFSIIIFWVYLLFGMSLSLMRDAIRTLDFWLVIASFLMQTCASSYVYATHLGVGPVSIVHALFLVSAGLFLALLDCVAVAPFTSLLKGIIGLMMATYCVFDLTFSATYAQLSTLYEIHLDLTFTVVTPQSMTQIASLSLLILFAKVAARTLWMKSSLVFFQIGAVEEVMGEDDFVDVRRRRISRTESS